MAIIIRLDVMLALRKMRSKDLAAEIWQSQRGAIRHFGKNLPRIGLPTWRFAGIRISAHFGREIGVNPQHLEACAAPWAGVFSAMSMSMVFDIADRARLPWRFFGVAKSNLRPRLHG